jgi:2'-5' RNA ligase
MRAFLAIPLPDPVRARLAAAQEALRHSAADVKWVDPSQLHLTLKFFPDLADPDRDRLIAALASFGRHQSAYPAALGQLGAFPSIGAPRVIWIGLAQGAEQTCALVRQLEAQGAIETEARPFAAHITLGRVREQGKTGDLASRIRSMPPLEGGWMISGMTLYGSRLSSSGAVHTPLAELAFAPVF